MSRIMKPRLRVEVGEKFTTNEGSSCVVVSVENAKRIFIRFLDERAYEMDSSANALRNGGVKNPFHPSVHGVGFVGVGPYKSNTPYYSKWIDMLRRGHSEDFKLNHASYAECFVSPEWHNFQNFAAWLDAQENWGKKGFELDKDILIPGNKCYSPEACSLVPKRINAICAVGLDRSGASGVDFISSTGRYAARGRDADCIRRHLGVFSTHELASKVYDEFRSSVIRELAIRHKDEISEGVYLALMSYGGKA